MRYNARWRAPAHCGMANLVRDDARNGLWLSDVNGVAWQLNFNVAAYALTRDGVAQGTLALQ